jgi:phosphomannomutase
MMTRIFHKLRHQDSKLSYIDNIGAYTVTKIKDVSLGYDSDLGGLPEDKPVSASSEMITFELDNSIVITLRGSGTEPKLKYYIESKAESMTEAQDIADSVESALKRVLATLFLDGEERLE